MTSGIYASGFAFFYVKPTQYPLYQTPSDGGGGGGSNGDDDDNNDDDDDDEEEEEKEEEEEEEEEEYDMCLSFFKDL